MHHIRRNHNNISVSGTKFLFAAGKFRRTGTDEIDFEFAVPVHGSVGKLIWNDTLIIAVGFDLRTVYPVFSVIHKIPPKNRIVSVYRRITIDF